jgi:tetratricopeptide (TPR) repeat protein
MEKSRSVRVFLSSTFRDFGEERDLLVRKVFPALRAKLKDRFVDLVDVDLRWGITVEQAERGEVLPICLAEIDRSRPFFIGLLGERYGWIPPKEKYSPDLVRQRRWLKAHRGDKSVTELEILHGVLNDPKMAGRARFYFRSSEYAKKKKGDYLPASKDDQQRQRALKARIRTSSFPVIIYTTPTELAKRLERDLWKILDAEFPATSVPDAFERESMRHEAYAAPRRRLYLGGDEYLKALKELLRKNKPRILITGQSGGGKSALLANALVGTPSSRVYLFEHYLGASSDSADPVALVRRVIEYIRRVTGSAEDIPSDPQALFESFPMWIAIASAHARKARTRWVFVLDALNNLRSHQDLRWLPSYLPARVTFVISCLSGAVREALDEKGPWDTLTINALDRRGQARLVTAYLNRYNKTLPDRLQELALDHPLAGNPLWLKTLAEELRLFGSHEELEIRLNTLLRSPKGKDPKEAATVDDLFEYVLQRIEHDHGQKLVRNALTAIWASRAGLSEPELLHILDCAPAIWAPIRYTLDEMLLESGGRIIFAHDYVKIAVRDRYLASETKQRHAHRSLAKYFSSRPIDSRVVEELPHQWREARAWRKLEQTLTTLPMFEALIAFRASEEHLSYWLSLEAVHGKLLLEHCMKRAWRRWSLSDNDAHTGLIASNLAEFLRENDRDREGAFISRLGRHGVNVVARTLGPRHVEFAVQLSDLSLSRAKQGDYEEAESLAQKALSIAESSHGPQHLVTAGCLTNLAGILLKKRQHSAAEELYQRALAIVESALGPCHPETGNCLGNLGYSLWDRGDDKAAEPCIRRALTISQESQGPQDDRRTARLEKTLAEIQKNYGNFAAAESLYRSALERSERVRGIGHPNSQDILYNLAACLERQGRYVEAEELYRQELHIEKTARSDYVEIAGRYNNLANVLIAQQKYQRAEVCLRTAFDIMEKKLGLEHPNTKICMDNLRGLMAIFRRPPDPLALTSRGDFLSIADFSKAIACGEGSDNLKTTYFLGGIIVAAREDHVWGEYIISYMSADFREKATEICQQAGVDLEKNYRPVNEKMPLSEELRRVISRDINCSMLNFLDNLLKNSL